jgi:hypothetical protein
MRIAIAPRTASAAITIAAMGPPPSPELSPPPCHTLLSAPLTSPLAGGEAGSASSAVGLGESPSDSVGYSSPLPVIVSEKLALLLAVRVSTALSVGVSFALAVGVSSGVAPSDASDSRDQSLEEARGKESRLARCTCARPPLAPSGRARSTAARNPNQPRHAPMRRRSGPAPVHDQRVLAGARVVEEALGSHNPRGSTAVIEGAEHSCSREVPEHGLAHGHAGATRQSPHRAIRVRGPAPQRGNCAKDSATAHPLVGRGSL